MNPLPLPTHPRAVIVANPAAGGARRHEEALAAAGRLAEAGWTVQWRTSETPAAAAALAATAVAEGMEVVIAAGGDGTVNQVAGALAGTTTALGVLPLGTGNVLAADLGLVGIPTPLHRPDLMAAATALAASRVHLVDTGLARVAGAPPRRFLLMAGVGLDAAVTAEIEGPARDLKRALGPAAFGALGLKALMYTTGSAALIRVGRDKVRGPLLLALISNTRLYGGTLAVSPEAVADDGLFDVELFFGAGVLSSVAHFGAIVAGRPDDGASVGGPDEHHRRVSRRTTYLRVLAKPPLPVHVDAEPHGTTPATFTLEPGSLRLLVPPTAAVGLFTDVSRSADRDVE